MHYHFAVLVAVRPAVPCAYDVGDSVVCVPGTVSEDNCRMAFGEALDEFQELSSSESLVSMG